MSIAETFSSQFRASDSRKHAEPRDMQSFAQRHECNYERAGAFARQVILGDARARARASSTDSPRPARVHLEFTAELGEYTRVASMSHANVAAPKTTSGAQLRSRTRRARYKSLSTAMCVACTLIEMTITLVEREKFTTANELHTIKCALFQRHKWPCRSLSFGAFSGPFYVQLRTASESDWMRSRRRLLYVRPLSSALSRDLCTVCVAFDYSCTFHAV